MANRYLGTTIDIHGGGQDLIFPHHENEVAQSECANGAPLARYWMHNGYINVDNRKMSKSLNNFFTVREVSQEFDYEVIRFFMLSAQYRSPVNFSKELMEQAKNALDRLYNCLLSLEFMAENSDLEEASEHEKELFRPIAALENDFRAAMDDDLNTANAIAVLFDMVKAINTAFHENEPHSREILNQCSELLKKLGGVLGILNKQVSTSPDAEIEQLIEQRQAARKNKDWATADAIRDRLASMDIILEDTPLGVKWKRK